MLTPGTKSNHGGNVWLSAQKWGLKTEDILDYSANINPLGMPDKSRKAIERNLDQLVHYPEPDGKTLKEALAKYLGVNTANIVLGNGGSELIYLLGRIFYQSRILLLAPCFSEYGEGLENPIIFRVRLRAEANFEFPLMELCQQLQEKDLIFIGNPNNPTGTLFNRQELEELIIEAKKNKAMVIIDEAFIDFVGNDAFSLRDCIHTYPNLIIAGSLTKFFALPGLRIGYALAAPGLINRMEYLLPPWRINTLALVAAEAALTSQDYIRETLDLINREREGLFQQINLIKGLKVFPGCANYLLVHAREAGLPTAVIQARLEAKAILIRDCNNFFNLDPYYFRIAVRSREENLRLVSSLKEVVT